MVFNPSNLKDYGLFKLFWNTPEGTPDGLSHRALDEVTPEGVDNLHTYAMEHELDGKKSAVNKKKVDADEKALLKHVLEHEYYGGFFEQESRPKLFQKFGMDPGSVHPVPAHKVPKDSGDVAIPSGVSQHSPSALANASIDELAATFKAEYASRKSYFEGSSVPAAERELRTLGLLKSYAEALWSRGARDETDGVGHDLLDAFEALPYSKGTATQDYNGMGFGAAQSLVSGLDPNLFAGRYPKAGRTAETTYLAMNDQMAEPMSYVDKYRVALGKKAGAEALERRSPLGYMIGEESGHTKHGNLEEKTPFSTSGLNWGVLLFPGDEQIKKLPPKEGFEFPIDCIDALNNAVVAKPVWGDRIIVRNAGGQQLTVEKVIHNGANGKPESWSAVFKKDGQVVEPSTVLGLIVTSGGQIKGDGEVGRSLDMWWWGFCDRNTAQHLYKSKYNIPQLDVATVKIKAGTKTISIPKEMAQKLLDADVPDLVTKESYCGFRFNDEPQQIRLKNGQTIEGRVEGLALDSGPGTTRLPGDMLAVHDAPRRPMLGTLEVEAEGSSQFVDVRNVKTVTKKANGEVVIKTKSGWPEELTGKLLTAVPWDKAKTVGGKKVLKQTADHVIRGGFTIRTSEGTRREPASAISAIVGETSKDLRLSTYMTWIDQNGGMFATDSALKEVVSNGMRWVNKVELREETGSERPEWAGTEPLSGIEGPIERQAGDKIVFVRGMYAYDTEADPTSSAFSGWMQVSKRGRILNEGFVSGQPDFGWSASGPLNWGAESSFNPNMVPELRLAILVNGIKSITKLEELAEKLNLPANWKSYRVG